MITQIGSVPFPSSYDAVAYSLRHTYPFLPERVPSLELLRSMNTRPNERMEDIINAPGTLGCIEPFKKAVKGVYKTVKIQCPGPAITAQILMGRHKEDSYTLDNAFDDAFTVADRHLSAILDGLGVQEAIIFLDEPSLNTVGFDYASLWSLLLEHLREKFPKIAITGGVHACCALDWKVLASSPVEIVSHDASKWDITRDSEYRKGRNGKRIAWGIQKLEDVRDYQQGDLITPTCGLGLKTTEDAYATLEMLQAAEKLNF